MGDSDVNNKTMPENLSPWIDPNDKVPILLALSLYGEIRKELFSFKLFRNDIRCAAWIGPSNIVIIGCRGTSIGSKYGTRDLQDDSIIALNSDYCDLTLVTLISKLVQDVYKKINNVPSGVDKVFDFVLGRKREVTNIIPTLIFAGHSLGGTAAICSAMKYPNSRAISLNGGAAPTNPILQGVGPERATHYHIVGDLISSHMSNSAARVVRVKIPNIAFGTLSAHNSGNILNKPFIIYSPTQEDDEYVRWGYKPKEYSVVSNVLALTPYHTFIKVLQIVDKNPIPNSDRWLAQQVIQ